MLRSLYLNTIVVAFPSVVAARGLDPQYGSAVLLQMREGVVVDQTFHLDENDGWVNEDAIRTQYTVEEIDAMIESGEVVTRRQYHFVAKSKVRNKGDVVSVLRTGQAPSINIPSQATTTPKPDVAATTAEPDCAETGTCSIYEDPHIRVFDGPQISLLSTAGARGQVLTKDDGGDMWLVRSSEVSIQGRYLPDPDLPKGNLFVRAIAIGGPFLNGNKLIVGPLEEQISWNGVSVLETQDSILYIHGMLRAKRHANSHLVQDMTQRNPGLDIELPLGVKLTVNRLKKHVNVFIQMSPASGGQGGLCGNFNCNPGDDSIHMIFADRNPRVLQEDSLFEQ